MTGAPRTNPQQAPRLYSDLAGWVHLLTAPAGYAEEAAFYSQQLIEACDQPPQTVLELGSGGGDNASHMKARFEMTLTDLSPQMLQPTADHGGHDGGGRGLRYLDWTWDPGPNDDTYTVDFAYLLREADGSVRVEYDKHIEGLFSCDAWLRLLYEAGFQARALPFDHSEEESGSLEVFLASKPRSPDPNR